MVQRNYQAPSFAMRDTREVQQGQVQGADTRVAAPLTAGDESWRDRLLGGLVQMAQPVLEKAVDVHLTNQYLEGQAAVGVVESEAELQGNPLTRDWKVAGYRDTMGKLALADMEAQFIADLPKLREQDPEKLKEYLSSRRQKIAPALASMSLDARKAVAGQMLLQDRAATKKWTSEHAKFIIETKAQALHTQLDVAYRGLEAAQVQVWAKEMPMEGFTDQLRSTAGILYGSVWADNSLPQDVKKQLTFEALQRALAKDNVALYDYIANNPLPGQEAPLTAMLEGDQQLKLSNAYREAYQRSADARNLTRLEQVATFEAQIDAGKYSGTYSDAVNFLDRLVINKAITGERRGTLLNKLLDKQYKAEQNTQFAEAITRGDVGLLYSAGKDISDGIKALEGVMAARAVSPAQRLGTWLQVGNNGIDEGFKKAGEYLGVSLRQIVDSKDGTVLPQHVEVFRTINNAVRAAEQSGKANTRARLLSGLPEDDRMFAERVFRLVDGNADGTGGATVDEAIQQARKAAVEDAALTPAVRAARAQKNSNAVATQIDALEPVGLLGLWWGKLKGSFSGTAKVDIALRPRDAMAVSSDVAAFGASPTAAFYAEQVRSELRQEASSLMLTRPSATADEVMNVAKANVLARTIETKQGPLVLPRNVNLQTVFGIAPGNQAALGKAIDGMLTGTVSDSRWQLSFAQGRLYAQEYDNKGARVGTGMFLEADQIRARIQEDTAKEQRKASEVFGPGKTVEADGVKVSYNGVNNAGVANTWMASFRDNLVANEGVRSTVYKDSRGIDTVGVGVSSRSKFFPKAGPGGKISQQDIQVSFLEASDAAARTGASIMRRIGIENQATFELMSELAYQSGPGFLGQSNKVGDAYRAFASAMQSGDVGKAQEAFQSTAAFLYSAPKRQNHYLSLIERAMKG